MSRSQAAISLQTLSGTKMTHSQTRKPSTSRTTCLFRNIVYGTTGILIAAALTVGAAVWGENRGDVPANTKTTYVTIEAGQTLWGVISAHDKRDNMNAAIAWTENLNHINGDIQPGMTIEVPVGK